MYVTLKYTLDKLAVDSLSCPGQTYNYIDLKLNKCCPTGCNVVYLANKKNWENKKNWGKKTNRWKKLYGKNIIGEIELSGKKYYWAKKRICQKILSKMAEQPAASRQSQGCMLVKQGCDSLILIPDMYGIINYLRQEKFVLLGLP